MSVKSTERPYTLIPLPVFGAEVTGIDLKEAVSEEVVEKIKEDVAKCDTRPPLPTAA
jgi:hypothetical protein